MEEYPPVYDDAELLFATVPITAWDLDE